MTEVRQRASGTVSCMDSRRFERCVVLGSPSTFPRKRHHRLLPLLPRLCLLSTKRQTSFSYIPWLSNGCRPSSVSPVIRSRVNHVSQYVGSTKVYKDCYQLVATSHQIAGLCLHPPTKRQTSFRHPLVIKRMRFSLLLKVTVSYTGVLKVFLQ